MFTEQINKKIAEIPELKKEIISQLGTGSGLIQLEDGIQKWLCSLGSLILNDALLDIEEPTLENQLEKGNKTFSYHSTPKRTLINRFGGKTEYHRRVYYEFESGFVKEGECFSPFEEALGIDSKGGYTPAMAYINTLCGTCDAYIPAAHLISEILQFKVGSTGVQNTTERTGASLDVSPVNIIPEKEQSTESSALLVTIDATGTPRIDTEPCTESGRASLTNPTKAKMCTAIQIEKFRDSPKPRNSFKDEPPKPDNVYNFASYADDNFDKEVRNLAREATLRAGRNTAKLKVFKGDGLASNWKLYQDYFSDFIAILDPYHALEHLASALRAIENIPEGTPLGKIYNIYRNKILSGEVLLVTEELREKVDKMKGKMQEKARIELEYLISNRDKMLYDVYLGMGIPIGSGNIESLCKRLASRFKKNGMRWKAKDNQAVMNTRVYLLNGQLKQIFERQPTSTWKLKTAA